MRAARAVALGALALLAAGSARAQRVPAPMAGRVAPPAAATAGPPRSLRDLTRQEWVRPLASLLVPGTGQLLARQERGFVYLAAEAWIVARTVALMSEGRRDRHAFQDLAFRVARSRFTAERRDGGFEYYESMGHYVESGAFDLDGGAGFLPEQDTLTFNGATWLLARRTFFPNPDSLPDPLSAPYQRAVAFYSSRAVQESFRWSWRDARLEQDVFRAQIRASDDAYRAATNFLGALVLNHLGSAIDALITFRASRIPPLPHFGPGLEPAGLVLYWNAVF